MQIEARGIVYDAHTAPPHRRIAFFTSLCPLRSGTILCGFQVGSAKHAPDATIGVCRSRDGGATWDSLPVRFETTLNCVPGSLAGGEFVEVAPGRVQMLATWFDRSDPSRPLFDPTTEGILRSKLLVADSNDEGETWSPWRQLSTGELTGCATTGPIVAQSDGTLAYAFESFKEFDDPQPGRHAAWIVISRDGGHTFSQPLLIAADPQGQVYYWDQRLCSTGDPGQFLALFWTHDRTQQQDRTVHLRYLTVDGDQLCSEPMWATTIRGQIAAPLAVDANKLLAFVVDRVRPGTMKLWHSRDRGRTWPEDDGLVVHTHDERAAVTQTDRSIDFAQYWEDMGKWSFGHPAIRRLDRRRVLLAYYAGTPQAMNIHWARVRLEEDSPAAD